MKINLLIFLFVLLCLKISAQNSKKIPKTIEAGVYWLKGEEKFYNIHKTKKEIRAGKVTKNTESDWEIRFFVADSTEEEYTIHWSIQKVSLSSDIQLDPISEGILKSYENLKMIYTTDATGSFMELKNWKEVRDFMFKSTDEILSLIPKEDNKIDEKALKNIMDQLKFSLSTKESVENYFIQEIQLFHTFLGYEYDTTQEVDYEGELPGIFGTGNLAGKGTIKVLEVTPEKGICKLENKLIVEEEAVKKMVQTLMEKFKENSALSKEEQQKGLEQFKNLHLNTSIIQTCKMDYLFGWPIEVESIKSIETQVNNSTEKRIDTMTIKEILN